MADVFLHATSGEVAMISGTKTILQLLAAAQHRVRISGWTASFKGTSATDPPVLMTILRQTNATNLTAGVVDTNITKKNSADTETIQTSTFLNNGGEPGAGAIIENMEIHPQTGFRMLYPAGQELIIPGGGRLGFRIVTTLTYSCIIDIDLEE